ncbi:hypothetical protein [Mesorhizobium sp. M1A.F.Ca.IN.022.07.1.1]|uniref:hypothetical protein n=1 Tax=Mesorhizobium sp. M1A.F.Ca.IN.022.07.1.1 TaxID=2496767 RepID=UPI0013DEE653
MVEELNPAGLKHPLHTLDVLRSAGDWSGTGGFHAPNCIDVYASKVGYVLLLNPDQCAGGFELISGCEHSMPLRIAISSYHTQKAVDNL